ncbi:MAG TPA: uracil-DNA glycosylase [Abditibacteriaceae bacterium]
MDRQRILLELAEEVRVCPLCRLAQTRTQAVPGEGDPFAKLMFIGEGPGENEDKTGRPFVGKAGQLLNRLLRDIGLKREDVFIANVVKCRPPGNREPLPDEVAACNDWLMAQIACVQPELIGLLGGSAVKAVLDPEARITRMRGKIYRKNGLLFMPLFHPAAALRRAEWMPDLEGDFQRLKALLNQPPNEDEIIDLTPREEKVETSSVEEQTLSLF